MMDLILIAFASLVIWLSYMFSLLNEEEKPKEISEKSGSSGGRKFFWRCSLGSEKLEMDIWTPQDSSSKIR